MSHLLRKVTRLNIIYLALKLLINNVRLCAFHLLITRVVLAVNAVHKMLHILHECAVSERRY